MKNVLMILLALTIISGSAFSQEKKSGQLAYELIETGFRGASKEVIFTNPEKAREWESLVSEICTLYVKINQSMKSNDVNKMYSKVCIEEIQPVEAFKTFASNWFFVIDNYYDWMSQTQSALEAYNIGKLYHRSEMAYLELPFNHYYVDIYNHNERHSKK